MIMSTRIIAICVCFVSLDEKAFSFSASSYSVVKSAKMLTVDVQLSQKIPRFVYMTHFSLSVCFDSLNSRSHFCRNLSIISKVIGLNF